MLLEVMPGYLSSRKVRCSISTIFVITMFVSIGSAQVNDCVPNLYYPFCKFVVNWTLAELLRRKDCEDVTL